MNQIKNLLQVGAQFELSGSPYEVAAVKQDEIRMAPILGGPMAHLKFKALQELMNGSQIEVTYTPRNLEDTASSDLRGMTKVQIASMNRRKHYVEGMLKLAPDNCCSKTSLEKHIPALADESNDKNPPKPSAVAGWIKKWRDHGGNFEVLANAPKPSRRDWLELNPESAFFVQQAIQTVYLTEQRCRKRDVYAEALRLIANHNACSNNTIDLPSRHVVSKAINAVDIYERDLKRHGKGYARRRHRAAGRMLVAGSPLEICMADGQHMDVLVVSESADGSLPEVLGRPYLTAIMDLRTRCILSAFISLQPFSGGTLLRAMKEAVVARQGFPRGVMDTMIVDNGCDYQDSGFLTFMNALDVTVEICSPHSPNGKAQVERFFRTLNEDLIHKLPGTTFSNPNQRGDYRSQDLATITLKELQRQVETWIQEIYHLRPHAAIGRAPLDVWNEETAR